MRDYLARYRHAGGAPPTSCVIIQEVRSRINHLAHAQYKRIGCGHAREIVAVMIANSHTFITVVELRGSKHSPVIPIVLIIIIVMVTIILLFNNNIIVTITIIIVVAKYRTIKYEIKPDGLGE